MHSYALKTIPAIILLAFLPAIPKQLAAQSTYSLTDLGVVSGRTFSEATGINDNGQVVGRISGGGFGGSLGFVWDPVTGMTALEGFRSTNDSNQAFGINQSGQIIGTSYRDVGDEHAIIWNSDGTKIDLGDLPGGNDNSFGAGINNAGQATGLGISSAGRRAFLWDSVNGMTDPVGDFPGGAAESRGLAINNAGQIAGYSVASTGPRAFLWDDTNGLVNLGDLAGGDDYSFAQGLNNVGQVVGFGTIESGRRAFIWDQTNGMVDLGFASSSSLESVANAINDDGIVVGTFLGNQGTFIWEADYGMLDLQDLLDESGTGWDLQSAAAINSSGQIVGWGVTPSGIGGAFLLTPTAVPEPGTGLLFGTAAIAVLLRRRRHTSRSS